MTTSAAPLSRSPLHAWHARRGARFVETQGWSQPASYLGAAQEVALARVGVGLTDLTGFARIGLRGPGIEAVAAALTGGEVVAPQTVARFEAGGTALVCRPDKDRLLLLGCTPSPTPLRQRLDGAVGEQPPVETDEASSLAGIGVLGPNARELLGRVTALDLDERLPVNHCVEAGVCKVRTLLVHAVEGPLPAYRLYVGWDVAESVWERLFGVGRGLATLPLGLDGWATLTMAVAPNF